MDKKENLVLIKTNQNLTSINIEELKTKINWREIDFSNNIIDSIGIPELLQNQTQLEILKFDDNPQLNDKNTIFANKNLKSLSFKGCGFTAIGSKNFVGFEKVEELYLCRNSITLIDADAFKKNGYLKVLDLSENKIKIVPPLTFSPLMQFEKLILSSNPIQLNLNNKYFIKTNSLKYLIMESCNITDIYDQTFSEIKNIQSINLNDNHIKSVAVKAFIFNSNLLSLLMENNHLKLFPVNILDTSKKLKELCVGENNFAKSKEFDEFFQQYTNRNLRTDNCKNDISFIENDSGENEFINNGNNNKTDEKSEKIIKLPEGISNFFIGSYLTIIFIIQAVAFVLLTLYLIKITKYEKIGSKTEINYGNTILNDNDIYKIYKLSD